jgi:preprotein translocase subunit YajC
MKIVGGISMGIQGLQAWWGTIAYFLFFIGVFVLFIIRPRKKQEKKRSEILASLKRGDKVVTIGGLHGELTRVMDDTIMLKVCENIELQFVKSAIAYKVEDK